MTCLKFLAVAIALACAGSAGAQVKPAPRPDFKVQIWGIAVADFNARMSAYAALRARLAQGLPALKVTVDPAEIYAAERALAARIRLARRGARGGEIFTPEIVTVFKELLALETRPGTCAALLEDNPGSFSYRINGAYPKDEPLSTVPVTILNRLPDLPEDVMYRFLGRHLILHDTRANAILDRIPRAIRCKTPNVG